MAVGSAKHVIVVIAAGTIRDIFLIRFASVHLLRRRCISISRPAQAAVTATIAETIQNIGMLSLRVSVALRSALVGKASAGSISRVPLRGVFEGI
jgi:hypothetical protein